MPTSQNYMDWTYLNEEGKKEFGDIFPDKVPILSMIPIMFEHPELKTPEAGYLLKGKELSEEQLTKLVDKLTQKFGDPDKDEIKKAILANDIPVRVKLTSGSGTKRPFMYMELSQDESEEDFDFDSAYDLDEEDENLL